MLSSSRSSLRDIRWPKHRFRGCLFVKRQRTKDTSFALNSRYASTSTKPSSSSDKDLCEFFDHPPSRQTFSPGHSGLFTHRGLTSPSSLQVLAEGTLKRAQNLTNRIVAASNSRNELFTVVKNLDKLSDMLCGVIDMAELVRNSHPDYEWVRSANDAYEKLCEFMNVLNTHVGLYKVLQMVLSDEEVMRSLSREAYYTAMVFWKDFEKSAINLPESQRKEFVSLSTEILVLGRQFLHDASSPRPPASISSAEIRDLKDKGLGTRLHLQARFTNRDLMVYPGSLQAQMIMRSAPAESPRRKLYVAANSSTSAQIDTLEQLLKARAKLAKLVGKESFAHMALDDKMAKSPENVRHFLNTSMDHTRPYARSALLTLSQRKQAHLNLPTLPIIQAWDRDYYCPPEPPAPPISLPTLTPGTVFKALSRLFEHLYGVTLRPADTSIGEVWHSDVRKLEVVDEDAGIIGWIYADLFARPGKASGAAHYTVRCSRRTDDDGPELLASSAHDESVQFSQEFDSLFQRRAYGQDGLYQLPVVVLLCEFTSPNISGGPSALQWHEVQTLFHEMGHAMHSMIGRTEYHNVAGTRCATDFVELPSILMEHFLNSPSVLSLFDHSEQAASRVGNHHEDPCHSIDTHSQILLASLDQEYHSAQVMNSSFSSTATLAYLQDTRGLIPSVPGTSWQTQFGHLFGYGATYYSYLFDRAIASRVWSRVFSADPLNRNNGEKFKNVLRYGGGMDPWTMVSSLLSTPELERGDEEAMREVGRWRIEDEVAMPGRH